jgi:predicted TIM-barrel fold metal-dependent hydrolase
MTSLRAHHRVDIHHHILPPGYMARARERIAAVAGQFARQVLDWTPARSIEAMERAGVQVAVTSISSPGIFLENKGGAAVLARECNEFAADIATRHAGRFGVFAALPIPDVEATLKEIEYASRALNVHGFGLYTNYDGAWLGDPKFAPVLEELNRREAVVFVHPLACPQCTNMLAGIPDAVLEYPFDTTRSIASLLYSGTLARCKDISFIFSHGGGALPVLAHRIARYAAVNKAIAERAPGDAMEQLRRLYFDVVSVTQPGPFSSLTALVPVSQLLFGSDYPYWPPDMTATGLAALGLSYADLTAIEAGNALRLLPSLAGARPSNEERAL